MEKIRESVLEPYFACRAPYWLIPMEQLDPLDHPGSDGGWNLALLADSDGTA